MEPNEHDEDDVAMFQLVLEGVGLLRSIKSMVKFFVVLTVLSIIGTIITLIVVATNSSNSDNSNFYGAPASVVVTANR